MFTVQVFITARRTPRYTTFVHSSRTPSPLPRTLPFPLATTAGLRQLAVRSRLCSAHYGAPKDHAKDTLFQVKHLTADGLGVVHHGGLGHLLRVVRVEGLRADARRPIHCASAKPIGSARFPSCTTTQLSTLGVGAERPKVICSLESMQLKFAFG